MVYCALETGLNSFENPKAKLNQWRELGAHAFVHVLAIAISPTWESYPEAFRVHPWIAERLRQHDPDDLYYPVERWLEGEPLEIDVGDPEEEDAKVQKLEMLLEALNPR